uniref:ATP synthase complex subunit 8 n=1 Tax=Minervarya manoharani TaxID=3372176 RepID=A0A343L6N9_9NEOB|nr:ATP synthase F0 subunit 8 [Fejervarya manoharani]
MPQLIPDPWLPIFLLAWLTLLALLPKVLNYQFPQAPAFSPHQTSHPSWNWKW